MIEPWKIDVIETAPQCVPAAPVRTITNGSKDRTSGGFGLVG
jgi:hypothetical protein